MATTLTLAAPAPTSYAQAPGSPRDPSRGGSVASRTGNEKAPAALKKPWGVHPTPVLLLQTGPVREELKLTRAQQSKIQVINDAFNQRRAESLRELPRPGGRLNGEGLSRMISALREENEAALARVLDRRQRARLGQISLRVEGPLALARPEVAVRVNLGPDQVEQIQAIAAEMREAQGRSWQDGVGALQQVPGEGDPVAVAKKSAGRRDKVFAARLGQIRHEVTGIEDEATRRIARVLTRGQKARYMKLLGEPFDVSTLVPGASRAAQTLPPADAPTELEPVLPAEIPDAGPRPKTLP